MKNPKILSLETGNYCYLAREQNEDTFELTEKLKLIANFNEVLTENIRICLHNGKVVLFCVYPELDNYIQFLQPDWQSCDGAYLVYLLGPAQSALVINNSTVEFSTFFVDKDYFATDQIFVFSYNRKQHSFSL